MNMDKNEIEFDIALEDYIEHASRIVCMISDISKGSDNYNEWLKKIHEHVKSLRMKDFF